MQNVYLVPGFLSTQLFLDSTLKTLLWADPNALILGYEGKMRLAADGELPGPPDGVPIHVGGPLPQIWDVVKQNLVDQLPAGQFAVVKYGWDWRKDIIAEGNLLADELVIDNTVDSPCTIVAHSAGGLVALMAWVRLISLGKTGIVRRIITLGTPFQGTYYPTELLTKSDDGVAQLLNWNLLAATLIQNPAELLSVPVWSWQKVFKLFSSFPAFFQVFPGLWGSLNPIDPLRVQLYDAANYKDGFSPSQPWLDYSRTVFQPIIANLANHPPAGVITCVTGSGTTTRSGLLDFTQLNASDSYFSLLNGDGVVSELSARLSPCLQVTITCDHQSLPLVLAKEGLLTHYILDPRKPPDPIPPPDYVFGVFAEQVTDTPPTAIVTGFNCLSGG